MDRAAVGPPLDPDATLLRRRMLEQGIEQLVVVDPKKLLERIMDALGGKPPKIISQTECGDEGLKMSIELELPFGDNTSAMVFEGAPARTRSAAEKNAIVLALRHLDQKCHMRVIDFSSRVARSLQTNKIYAHLKEAMASVQSILHSFEDTLAMIKKLAFELEDSKSKTCDGGQLQTNTLAYVNITSFLASMVERFSLKASETVTRFTCLEKQRIEMKMKWMDKTQPIPGEPGAKTVVLSSKYLLNYLLSYFGFGRATYSNGPVGAESVEAEAKFTIPHIKRLRLCGNLIIRGAGGSSTSSEEDAAFRSLLLMEENLNLKIVDLNHSRRVDTEQLQEKLLATATDVLAVGDAINNLWTQLMSEIHQHRNTSSYDTAVLSLGGKPEDHITAYQITMHALDKLEMDSAKLGYEKCCELFYKLEEIKCQLDTMVGVVSW